MTCIEYVEESIRNGWSDADLLDWKDGERGRVIETIEAARQELLAHGWTWHEEHHEFRKRGWAVWFRPQGKLAPPIVQWARVPWPKTPGLNLNCD